METPPRPIVYSLQFRGRITSLSSRVLEQRTSAPSQVLTTTVDANGLAGHVESGNGDEALLVSRLVLADDGSFDQSGTIEFAPGHQLAFHSVGAARLACSPDPHLRLGSAIWEIEGGEGQLRGARGRITSNFFLSDSNELTDNHFGLIFLAHAAATHAPDIRPAAPPPRLSMPEAWAQFRRSSALADLLADCALWGASCAGFPLYQSPGNGEDFELCASTWSDLGFYGHPETSLEPRTHDPKEE